MMTRPLNLFYEEPANDRWVKGDHVLRDMLRPLLFWRSGAKAAGYLRVFMNLRAGLDRLGIPYRINDYRHAQEHPEELVCILGKPHVLDKIAWKNPMMIGTALYSHPSDDPTLLSRRPVKKILVQCDWMKTMCAPFWGDIVKVWPVGIDTERWSPVTSQPKTIDVLLYDKIRWNKEEQHRTLVDPVRVALEKKGLRVQVVSYGNYVEENYRQLVRQSKAMVFICEHETQGLAYQEALSCDIPILAWDNEGQWVDREYFPNRVNFSPVTSVPYWDDRCGIKFKDVSAFHERLTTFLESVKSGKFHPRQYILEHLTLEHCAQRYADLAHEVGLR